MMMISTTVAESDKHPPNDFGRHNTSEESVFIRTTRLTLNLITNILIVMTVFVCLLYAWNTTTLTFFQVHIILCVLGYQFFMSQGVLVLSKYNSWSMYLPRRYKQHLHWILQLVGIALATLGSQFMITEKRVNFTTAHGITGLCALLTSLIGLFNGILAWYAIKTSYVNAYWFKMVHCITGIGTIFLSAACLCLGLDSMAFKGWSGRGDAIALIIFTCIFSVLVAMNFWILIWRKIRRFRGSGKMVIPPPPRMPENGNFAPGPAIVNEPPSSFVTFMNITNTITQLLLGAITCSAVMFANYYLPANRFMLSTHIYLCVIGYVVLMSQAILSLSPFTGWSNTFKHQDKKTIHWVMQIVGSVLAITGSMIRFFNVAAHFQTAHGSLGIIAFIFTCLSMIGGVVNLFSHRLGTDPKFIKIGHSCFGCITIILAFLALIFAFDKNMFRITFSPKSADMSIAFTVMALVGLLMHPCLNMIRKFK